MKTLNTVKFTEKVRKFTDTMVNDNRIMFGAEYLVRQKGEIIYHDALGVLDEKGGVMPKNHMFRIASMTKPVTSAALLIMVDEGKVDLMAPISDYIPGYTNMTVGHDDGGKMVIDRAATGVIRVFNLLSHTSGIGTAPLCAIQKLPWESLKATTEYYATQPLAFDPYTATSYSPTAAFDVAARIVEVTSGMDYEQFLRERIFEPLGITDMGFTPDENQQQLFVPVHSTVDGKVVSRKMTNGCVFEQIPYAAYCGGGGLFATAQAYSEFAEMLLCDGIGRNGQRILSEKTMQRMRTPHVPESMQMLDERWGLGVRVITSEHHHNHLPLGTFGWSGAYGTHFWCDPVNQITAVFMKNTCTPDKPGISCVEQFERTVYESLKD